MLILKVISSKTTHNSGKVKELLKRIITQQKYYQHSGFSQKNKTYPFKETLTSMRYHRFIIKNHRMKKVLFIKTSTIITLTTFTKNLLFTNNEQLSGEYHDE